MITIVGLGPGNKEYLTIGVLEALKNCKKVYLKTYKHPIIEFLKGKKVEFKSFDYEYKKFNNFSNWCEFIANFLIKEHDKYGDIVYGIPGNPLINEKSIDILKKLCEGKKISINIIPSVSFIDMIIKEFEIDTLKGLKIVSAFNIKEQILDKRNEIIITDIYDNFAISKLKYDLMKYYYSNKEVYIISLLGVNNFIKIPLYKLGKESNMKYLTYIYIPKEHKDTNSKDFYDLLNIIDILRGKNGCPWDRKQTHESLKSCLIEETYEVIEAIDKKDNSMIIEELGDVLLQVVFHAQIGKENKNFDINDIIKCICDKMIQRHPHVFGKVKVNNVNDVLYNWDKIKRKEQKIKTYTDELKHVPKKLPALLKAEKVQKKAAKVGFDWDKVECAFDKILEEFEEVKDVYNNKNKVRILEEVGDLIFACVNVARFLDIDPELALNYTIDKFISRFEYIEKAALNKGITMEKMTLKQMDDLWEKSKNK